MRGDELAMEQRAAGGIGRTLSHQQREAGAGGGYANQVREHSSAVELCRPHVAISPAMFRSSNGRGPWQSVLRWFCGCRALAVFSAVGQRVRTLLVLLLLLALLLLVLLVLVLLLVLLFVLSC